MKTPFVEQGCPELRPAISSLEAATRRYNVAIIDGARREYATYGSIRGIMTPDHVILIRIHPTEVKEAILEAKHHGYKA